MPSRPPSAPGLHREGVGRWGPAAPQKEGPTGRAPRAQAPHRSQPAMRTERGSTSPPVGGEPGRLSSEGGSQPPSGKEGLSESLGMEGS